MFSLNGWSRRIRDFLFSRQADVLSAAMILAASSFASRILGLVRDRVLAGFFSGEEIALYFASFRLPDTLFEILVFGTLSAAFIPTFVSYLSRRKEAEAWRVTGIVTNLALLSFLYLAVLVFLLAYPLARLLAPGFSAGEIDVMVGATRILLLTQGFFVLSFFLTGVLKSYQRFLVPALAPIFYNLGIIGGAIFLAAPLGIFAPVWGAVFGALLHFAVQLPLAIRLGFRPVFSLDIFHPGVRRILALAAPRLAELGALQILKASDLFFSSLISTASYGYLTFAQHLEMVPVSLFGLSLAEAALPALAWGRTRRKEFEQIFFLNFRRIIFLTLPLAAAFVVLRIPLVRLAFGASRFTWDSTVLTGYTLSAFAIGIIGQALTLYFVRAFYALQNTTLPVAVGVADVALNIFLSAYFILVLKLPVWGIGLAFALAALVQAGVLALLLVWRYRFSFRAFLFPSLRVIFPSAAAAGVMYFLLKVMDRSVWDKQLSFIRGIAIPERWDLFVLDTRYTLNLLVLTLLVALVGAAVYLVLCKLLGVEEIKIFTQFGRRLSRLRGAKVPAVTEHPED